MHVDTVRKWRRRFSKHGMDGLRDRPRPGRPRQFAPATVAEVKALACELPAISETPLAKWSCPELAREAIDRGLVVSVSASTVRRWLAKDAIKPWQHRTWIFPRDPNFATKAARVLDLYQRLFDGHTLRADEYVISADEKPGVQARRRIHANLPAGPGRAMRVEHEYIRGGTLAYLAAYDVHRARVFGRCEPTTGIVPFTNLVDQVMTTEPYASARRVPSNSATTTQPNHSTGHSTPMTCTDYSSDSNHDPDELTGPTTSVRSRARLHRLPAFGIKWSPRAETPPAGHGKCAANPLIMRSTHQETRR